jgi:DNA-directed RNA polymerase specialized sigma24 family protein
VFPTTIWTTIAKAGASDAGALERFAREYRQPVLQFVQAKGFRGADADDICQDVFLRLLSGQVLARATAARGRFRNLLLSVATHVIQDRQRRRRETPSDEIELVEKDPDFDRAWTLELTGRAFERLRAQQSPYYQVLQQHLAGVAQDRNKLWIARGKLVALIQHEVALTCSSPAELEEELRHLSPYLRPLEVPEEGG